ncbi:MAG: EAL domain-containing protein [Porticoccaceae bacterium]|nr:EAL domain-containing protein [Porticoccaceae bacterium]
MLNQLKESADRPQGQNSASSTDQQRHPLYIIEPQLFYPVLLITLLLILWITTFSLISANHQRAQESTISSATALLHTYEAQVVRALREIDQALNVTRRTYEINNGNTTLSMLNDWGLLLPNFLFVTSITDADGNIINSTRAFEKHNVSDQDYFRQQLKFDQLASGQPWQDPYSRTWKLTFSRKINTPEGAFAGIVFTSVEASYFVSGYEESKLGELGALGILGTDGIFRVRRTGEKVVSGEKVNFSDLVPNNEEFEEPESLEVRLQHNSWDKVKRYTAVSQLYDFPLAVVLGLSEQEQMQKVSQLKRVYLLRASVASVAITLIVIVLLRLSLQLKHSRNSALEEHIAHAKKIEHLAFHDSLTGLPNRSFFSQLLSQGIAESKRYERCFALLFLDLDRFKIINDTLGHDAGDELLKEVARRLTEALRETDTVARLGGDEFVVLLPEMNDEKQLSAVAKKILSTVGRPFHLAGQDLRVTVSIGISVFPTDGEDEQTLVKNADIAMYHAKEGGKNNFCFYSDELSADSLERLALESSLRVALDRNEFVLHYQEKHDLRSGEITGAEALLRWQHPTLGLIQPKQFLPLAEDTGLIIPIGRWVIEAACKQANRWLEEGLAPRCISVNLTERQFTDAHLLDDIASILHTTAINPTQLELEITESVLLSNFDRALETLSKIKKMGVRIAIDNFGTSYTSLSTLDKFHFDTLKIDGSVIRDIANEPSDKQLTEAIISVGRTMAMTIVAEGVETREQADFLLASSCDQVQGFYYNKPTPPS